MSSEIKIDTDVFQKQAKGQALDELFKDSNQAARICHAAQTGSTGIKGIHSIASALNADISEVLGYHGSLNTFQSLRLTRIEAGMTSTELSRKTGIHINTVGRYENDVIPGMLNARAIAQAFDKSIEEVFFRTVN